MAARPTSSAPKCRFVRAVVLPLVLQLATLTTMVQALLDGQRRIEQQLGIAPAETVVEGSALELPLPPPSVTSLGALPADSEDGQPPSAPSAEPETQKGSAILRV